MITHEVPHKVHNTKEATNNTEICPASAGNGESVPPLR
jgi:hypothetical protein